LNLIQDFQKTLRLLMKAPGFTTVAVLSLALGIGAATAVFALVNGVMLRSLQVPRPQELRLISWSGKKHHFNGYIGNLVSNDSGSTGDAVSFDLLCAMSAGASEHGLVFAHTELRGITLRARGEARVMNGLMVSRNFFLGLELKPFLGRTFSPEDSSPEADESVLLSHHLWQQNCDADPGIVGQSITLNNRQYIVLGVLPADFRGLNPGTPAEFYVPYSPQQHLMPGFKTTADQWWIKVMGRVKPGEEQPFRTALEVAMSRGEKDPFSIVLQEGRRGTAKNRDNQHETLWIMLGAVGAVLLVACANLSGLSLVRGAARRHEYAVRAAMGATRWKLMRPAFQESLLLSLVGSALGFLLAFWIRNGLSHLLAESPDGLAYNLSFSAEVMAFSMGLTLLTALFAGVLPALKAAQVDPLEGLKERASQGYTRLRMGKVLVVCQMAMSLMLLAGAGLFMRSMFKLLAVDLGFSTHHLLLVTVDPASAGHQGEVLRFHQQVQESLRALPGVQRVALSREPLMSGNTYGTSFKFSGSDQIFNTNTLTVDESFFSTMGIPIHMGRSFTATDSPHSPKVVVVSEAFVRENLPGQNPLGKRIKDAGEVWQIVGVSGDIRYDNARRKAPAVAFFPFQQSPTESACYILQTDHLPMAYVPIIRKNIATIDPAVPIAQICTQEELRDLQLREVRILATLCGFLAAFSLLLSCLGIYGLVSYNTRQRMGEFGIRLALGAQARDIRWLVLREALLLTAVGSGLGLLLSFALTRLLQKSLFGITPVDPSTLLTTMLLLALVTLLTAWLPTRRAATANPADTLRAQ